MFRTRAINLGDMMFHPIRGACVTEKCNDHRLNSNRRSSTISTDLDFEDVECIQIQPFAAGGGFGACPDHHVSVVLW